MPSPPLMGPGPAGTIKPSSTNTDGGLPTFGPPTGAPGVRMIYENVLQLQGRAGPRQVEGASLALSHNIGGAPQTCGIAILGNP